MFGFSLPPFMLKQLYRASSLRNRADGYEFVLQNPLMDATIIGVRELTVNEQPISLEIATFTQGDAPRTGASVDESSPVSFSKGQEVMVFVPGQPLVVGEYALKVRVKTEEFGTIVINVSDQVRG